MFNKWGLDVSIHLSGDADDPENIWSDLVWSELIGYRQML